MNQGNKSGDVEKWSDSQYVLKQCLLLTPYLDQYKKLRTPEQKPVLPLRRCISEELEGKEIECGSCSCVNTFCPYRLSPGTSSAFVCSSKRRRVHCLSVQCRGSSHSSPTSLSSPCIGCVDSSQMPLGAVPGST